MKKLMLLIICIVGGYSLSHAQDATIEDFIIEQRGDTLLVKDSQALSNDGQGTANALPDLVALDTDAPDTRVYELRENGYYFVTYQIAVSGDRPLNITGTGDTPHVSSTSEARPATLTGAQVGDANINGGLIAWSTNTTLKNLITGAHSQNGTQGWSFSDAAASGIEMHLDNVYMEHTNWIFVQSNAAGGNTLRVTDSYFVNMNGNGCRRNGGVFDIDGADNNPDEIFVENSTHVMGAGMIYKFRSKPVNKVTFNHNTFVNISNAPIATMGYQTDMIVTNNLFVNTNVQAYYPGLDIGETDQDYLPMGIINVDSLVSQQNTRTPLYQDTLVYLPEEFTNADPSEWDAMRKILVDRNGVFWSSELDDIPSSTIDENQAYLDSVFAADGLGEVELMNSMITMNSRTQAMFDNDEDFPYLTLGSWLEEGDPEFTEDFGLLDPSAALGDFIEFTTKSMDGGNALQLAEVRTESNPADPDGDYFAISDWPIPFDLSYSNSAYLTGGFNGYPVGDLNWFPAEKAQWEAQKEAEYQAIEDAKNAGEPLPVSNQVERPNQPKSIKLDQNYPNPFNPTTNISFELPNSERVSLKVYDMLGREVATLMNNEMVTGGQHEVTFNATNLASGIYMYVLQGQNFKQSRTMTLIK